MQQRLLCNLMIFLIAGGVCLSFSPGYDNTPPSDSPTVQGVRPGVSDDSSPSQRMDNRRPGREEIAQADSVTPPYPRDGHFRMGNWDYHENWRYNRDAFYRGESQPEAYREDHPYGPGGIGYDADINYHRNLRRYQELYQKNPTPENKAILENYVNPYHVHHYEGNYGEGSYNDAYPNNNSGNYYNQPR